MTFNTRGIVLNRQNFCESDRLYSIYTADFGKIQVLAKGARKIKSKLAPHLESFGEVSVLFARGKTIDRLAGASLYHPHTIILNDLDRMRALGYCFNILDGLTGQEQGDKRVYNLLHKLVGAFNEKKSVMIDTLIQNFISELLPLLGYRRELYECKACKKKIIPGGVAFDLLQASFKSADEEQTGLVCGRCPS